MPVGRRRVILRSWHTPDAHAPARACDGVRRLALSPGGLLPPSSPDAPQASRTPGGDGAGRQPWCAPIDEGMRGSAAPGAVARRPPPSVLARRSTSISDSGRRRRRTPAVVARRPTKARAGVRRLALSPGGLLPPSSPDAPRASRTPGGDAGRQPWCAPIDEGMRGSAAPGAVARRSPPSVLARRPTSISDSGRRRRRTPAVVARQPTAAPGDDASGHAPSDGHHRLRADHRAVAWRLYPGCAPAS